MKWISVKDKLPKDLEDQMCPHDAVLVISIEPRGPAPLYGIGRWHAEGWEIMENSGAHSCTGFYTLESQDITHWMQFPNMPKREKIVKICVKSVESLELSPLIKNKKENIEEYSGEIPEIFTDSWTIDLNLKKEE